MESDCTRNRNETLRNEAILRQYRNILNYSSLAEIRNGREDGKMFKVFSLNLST